MRKKDLRLVGILFCIAFSYGHVFSQKYYEKDYADAIAQIVGGDREVSVYGGRVDIVTETHAYEVEWAHKWKNAIGQSLWYAQQTLKQPAIVLILKEKKDYKYFVQLNSSLSYAGLDDKIKVLLYPNDFVDR